MQPKKIPENLPFKVRTSGSMTLIFIADEGEHIEFANTATKKDELMSWMANGTGWDKILLAWNGQYRTDIFEYTKEDHEKHYR